MNAPAPLPLASEPTPAGEQTLIPGVRPVTLRDRLAMRLAAPMRRACRRSRSISASSTRTPATN